MPHLALSGSHTGGVQAVIFDFGNTLFAHAPLPDTVVAAARSLGVELTLHHAVELAERIEQAAHTPEELALGRDLSTAVWAARWPALYGIADDVAPGMGLEIHRLMHAPDQWVPFVDTVFTLRRLHAAGVRVGVLSNTGWDVRAVFRHHELVRFVDAFALSYEIGAVKPQSEAFARACALLEVLPADALMVGDDTVADAGAARAGLRTLLLPVVPAGFDNGVGLAAQLFARS
jgi:FMN phosphatase YigB (HAD superfamily)